MRAPRARCHASSGVVFKAFGVGSSGSAFSINGPLHKGHPPAIGADGVDPPLSRYLKDSGRCAPLTSSVRLACSMPAGFPEIPDPAAVLLPERFRGPVAPSAAEQPSGQTRERAPLSPAPGGWDERQDAGKKVKEQ